MNRLDEAEELLKEGIQAHPKNGAFSNFSQVLHIKRAIISIN